MLENSRVQPSPSGQLP